MLDPGQEFSISHPHRVLVDSPSLFSPCLSLFRQLKHHHIMVQGVLMVRDGVLCFLSDARLDEQA